MSGKVLDMPLAIAAVEDAHRALSEGRAQDLPRRRYPHTKIGAAPAASQLYGSGGCFGHWVQGLYQ